MKRTQTIIAEGVPLIKKMIKENMDLGMTETGVNILQIINFEAKSITKSGFFGLGKRSDYQRHFFGFAEDDVIGEGTYGVIYKAVALNPHSGEVNINKSVVIKMIDAADFDMEEYKISSKFLAMYKPIIQQGSVFLVQPYLGQPINEHPDVPKLSPKNLLSVLKNLAFKFNEMHHVTLRTGIVIAHCDVKPGNILINFIYDEKEPDKLKRIEINPIDFGLSQNLKKHGINNDDSKDLYNHTITGNDYFPDETKTQAPKFGIKTDIWQLAGVMANLLGYVDDEKIDDLAIFQKSYTLQRLTKIKEFKLGPAVDKILVDFLNRMRHADYHKRPESDEMLKFFNLLDQFFKLNSTTPLPEKVKEWRENKNLLQAQLASLAEGSWVQDYKSSNSSISSSSSSSSDSSSSSTRVASLSQSIYGTFSSPSESTSVKEKTTQSFDDLFCLQ